MVRRYKFCGHKPNLPTALKAKTYTWYDPAPFCRGKIYRPVRLGRGKIGPRSMDDPGWPLQVIRSKDFISAAALPIISEIVLHFQTEWYVILRARHHNPKNYISYIQVAGT